MKRPPCPSRVDRFEGVATAGNGQLHVHFYGLPAGGKLVDLELDMDADGRDIYRAYVEVADPEGPLKCGHEGCPKCEAEDERVLAAVFGGVATCVQCGCTDTRACPAGCCWLVVDRERRVGVCSSCATSGGQAREILAGALA